MKPKCPNANALAHFCFSYLHRRRRLRTAIRISLLAVLALIGSSCAGDKEKKQVVELRKIADQTPVFPGFQKTGEKVVLKQGMVYFNTYYASDAQFSDVKNFYDRVLAEKGWGSPQQPPPSVFVGEAHSVSYRRGDYVIAVEQSERAARFSVVYIWDPR